MGDEADDARDWELTHPRPPAPKRRTIVVPVVGITFAPGYPNNIHHLRRVCDQIELSLGREGPAVVLKRNPSNPHDANAIEVHVPAIGQMIGHVGREHAAKWAPKLDAGETPRCWVESVRVKQGHEDRPGIDIRTEWGPIEPHPGRKIGKTRAMQDAIEPGHEIRTWGSGSGKTPKFQKAVKRSLGQADGIAYAPTDEL